MRGLPEIPDEDVAEYWQLVRAALVAGGMSKKEAAVTAKAYREYMKPASWTIYNRDPEDSAEMAKSYTAWMRKEQEQEGAKPKAAPKLTKNADKLPTEDEIAQLPRWARVAFAARCARRVEPLFKHHWPEAPQNRVLVVKQGVEIAERSSAAAATYTISYSDVASAIASTNVAVDSLKNDAVAAVIIAADTAAYTAAYTATATDTAVRTAAAASRSSGERTVPFIRADFQRLLGESRLRHWTRATPVPPAVFGPLWPEGPPKDWPELPKPTKLKLTVQVPDGLGDAAVREKLQKLTTALARLNVAGGGHGLELVRPIVFTQEQEQVRADVVEQESKKPKGRGHSQGGR